MRPARPGFGAAVFVSCGVTAAALAVLYAGASLTGAAYAPFALVDYLTRRSPGPIITSAIESIVKLLQALGVSDLSTAAKAGERASGVVLVFLGLTVVGALLLLWPRAMRTAIWTGAVLGALLGAIAISVQASMFSALWTTVVLAGWGAVIGRARERLVSAGAPDADATVTPLDRRRFIIRLAGTSATITVIGAVVGYEIDSRRRRTTAQQGAAWSATHALPNADDPVAPVKGTRPEFTPLADHYRIDINTSPPAIDRTSWRLRIHGLVDRPMELTLDDLRKHEATHQLITLSCISNPIGGSLIGTTRWSGVSLGKLLDEAGLQATASHLLIRSADGFFEVVGLDVVRADPRVMLAYDWDGLPIAQEHGFPLRLYVPDRYGMKQPKWIESIEVINEWRPGYWVERGWSREAHMQITSFIDAVGTDMMNAKGVVGTTVPVGGIAHAGARGISRVEVRVDSGEWQPATLRHPLSGTTWVVWRYDWPFQAGQHTLTVRCADGSGAMQIPEPSAPHPNGATGLNDRRVML